jgi:DNA-binding beta-propeller fold protein YncE
MPQYDSAARKVYVNLRSLNQVAEIDPATDTVAGRYPVEGRQGNHGMAMDSEHHRAFLLCGGSRTLTVFALDLHRALANLPLARAPMSSSSIRSSAALTRLVPAE